MGEDQRNTYNKKGAEKSDEVDLRFFIYLFLKILWFSILSIVT
jgi:hypothetical protein